MSGNKKRLVSFAATFFVVALVSAACAPTTAVPTTVPEANTAVVGSSTDTAIPAAATPEMTAAIPNSGASAMPSDTAMPAAATPEVTPVIPNTGASAAPEIMVSQVTSLGGILTDGSGRTLYAFANDTPGVSNCTGACATNWPPFTVAAGTAVTLGNGATATVGTIQRPDGSTQVTVNNMPVYYWSSDTKPGDTSGQGKGGVWFVLDSAGNLVKTTGGAATTSAAQPAGPYVGPLVNELTEFAPPTAAPAP